MYAKQEVSPSRTKLILWLRLVVSALFVAAFLVAAACQSDDEQRRSSPTTEQQARPVSTATPDPFKREGGLGTPLQVYDDGDMTITVSESDTAVEPGLANGPTLVYSVTVEHVTRSPYFHAYQLHMVTRDGDVLAPLQNKDQIAAGQLAPGEKKSGLVVFGLTEERQVPQKIVFMTSNGLVQATWSL